jgi:hypothetical protein
MSDAVSKKASSRDKHASKRTLPHYAMGKSIDIICFLWNSMKLERNNPIVLHPSLPSKLVHTIL